MTQRVKPTPQCGVCWEQFKRRSPSVTVHILLDSQSNPLPKTHRVHKRCAEQWFKNQITCPICNVNLLELAVKVGNVRQVQTLLHKYSLTSAMIRRAVHRAKEYQRWDCYEALQKFEEPVQEFIAAVKEGDVLFVKGFLDSHSITDVLRLQAALIAIDRDHVVCLEAIIEDGSLSESVIEKVLTKAVHKIPCLSMIMSYYPHFRFLALCEAVKSIFDWVVPLKNLLNKGPISDAERTELVKITCKNPGKPKQLQVLLKSGPICEEALEITNESSFVSFFIQMEQGYHSLKLRRFVLMIAAAFGDGEIVEKVLKLGPIPEEDRVEAVLLCHLSHLVKKNQKGELIFSSNENFKLHCKVFRLRNLSTGMGGFLPLSDFFDKRKLDPNRCLEVLGPIPYSAIRTELHALYEEGYKDYPANYLQRTLPLRQLGRLYVEDFFHICHVGKDLVKDVVVATFQTFKNLWVH